MKKRIFAHVIFIFKKLFDKYIDIKNKIIILKEPIIDVPDKAKNDTYVGVVLDATSENNRFLAMKQLLDIAKRKSVDYSYSPLSSDFDLADKGIICKLPKSKSTVFQNYNFDVIYKKNEIKQTLPASTTKIMTLITGMDYITSFEDVITLENSDIQSEVGKYFQTGDILTIEDLIIGMMLPSSNTCAMAFAHHLGKKILQDDSASFDDSINAFIAQMNKKAALIGMRNSTFTTPSGFGKTNYSCAYDLMCCAIELCSYPEILKIWNKKTYTISVAGPNARNIQLKSTVRNKVLENSYCILGGKTGTLNYGMGQKYYALIIMASIK